MIILNFCNVYLRVIIFKGFKSRKNDIENNHIYNVKSMITNHFMLLNPLKMITLMYSQCLI